MESSMDHILDQYCIDNTGHHPYRWAKNDLKFHRVTGERNLAIAGDRFHLESEHQRDELVNKYY